MSKVIPCIKGRLGSTDYYEAVVKARELVAIARPARESDDWTSWTIEERLQRELNKNRIKNELVPYLAQSQDRFFGSLIILVYRPQLFEFEDAVKLGAAIPVAYRVVADRIGFLTIDGGELIALDGQHRLVALRDVVGTDEHLGPYAADVPNDDIPVIFIEFESHEKTRRIFNKVNRYAKPTSRGDNIITSEDDGYAIVTRRLLSDGPLNIPTEKGDLLVNWKSNTISDRSTQLTTISAIYETVKALLEIEGVHNFDEKHRVNRPSEEELQRAYEAAHRWWELLLTGIDAYREAVKNIQKIPEMRTEHAPASLLFKPVGTMALVKGIATALGWSGRKLSLEEAIARANDINWSLSADLWRGTVVGPDRKIVAGKDAVALASNLVAYLIAPEYAPHEVASNLAQEYFQARGEWPSPATTNPIEMLPSRHAGAPRPRKRQ